MGIGLYMISTGRVPESSCLPRNVSGVCEWSCPDDCLPPVPNANHVIRLPSHKVAMGVGQWDSTNCRDPECGLSQPIPPTARLSRRHNVSVPAPERAKGKKVEGWPQDPCGKLVLKPSVFSQRGPGLQDVRMGCKER
jgi:hypothetical protein